MGEKVVHVIAGSDEQAKEWMGNEPDQELPPVAQDFTNNPFSASTPVDVPDVPIKNIGIEPPTPEEEESMINRLRSKLGLKDGFRHFEELTNDKLKLVDDGSKLASSVLSAILGLMFTLLGDEYELLAPTEDMAFKVVQPIIRIYARHSTLVSEISPDYIDASAAIAGLAIYTKHVVKTMREIKEMKLRGYVYQKPSRVPEVPDNFPAEAPGQPEPEPEQPQERYRQYGDSQRTGRGYIIANPNYEAAPFQNGAGMQVNGRADIPGFASHTGQPATNVPGNGPAYSFAPVYTDEQQRRNHEALLRLTSRDVQHRVRRAGGLY